MPEETDKNKPRDLKPGFAAPIEAAGKIPEHIAEDTLMAKGFDPDTKNRVSINIATLKAEFGEKKGLEVYRKAAKVGGFLDPDMEPNGSNFFPDLDLSTLDSKTRAEVDALLV